jgi:hypothetical protein
MKQFLFSFPVWRVALCALFIASANQSVNARESNSPNRSGAIFATSAADGGRLVIQRSPVLGYNVSISLQIDGRSAGTLVRGTYERFITPGPHTLTASPNISGGEWHGALNVVAGKTYFYNATYKVNKLVLTPVSGSR